MTVVTVKAGENPPQAFLEKILSTHDVSVSMALTAKEGTKIDTITFLGKEWPKLIENIPDMLEQAKEDYIGDRLLHFCDNAEDIQPIPLIQEDDGRILIAAMADGLFATFEGSVPAMCREFLTDAVKEEYTECDGDLNKTRTAMDAPKFRRGVNAVLKPRGEIVLIFAEGEPLRFAENNLYKEYKWGSTSKHLGYKEETEEATPEETPAPPIKQSLADKMQAMKKTKPTAEVVGKLGPAPVKSSVPAAQSLGYTGDDRICRPADYDNEATKRWIYRNFNVDKNKGLPDGWQSTSYGWNPTSLKSDSGLKPLLPTKMAEQLRDIGTGLTSEVPAIIPPKYKEELVKMIDKGLMGAKDIQGIESKHPPFAEQVQRPLAEIALWRFEDFRLVGKQNMHTLACICNSFRHAWLADHPEVMEAFKNTIAEGAKDIPIVPEKVATKPTGLAGKMAGMKAKLAG